MVRELGRPIQDDHELRDRPGRGDRHLLPGTKTDRIAVVEDEAPGVSISCLCANPVVSLEGFTPIDLCPLLCPDATNRGQTPTDGTQDDRLSHLWETASLGRILIRESDLKS